MVFLLPTSLRAIETPVGPFPEQGDQHSVAWARRHDLVGAGGVAEKRLSATRPGLLAACCYPGASLEDQYLTSEWITWLFFLDDQNDEGSWGRRPEALERALAELYEHSQLDDASGATNPLGAALGDIIRKLAGRMPDEWRHRFQLHLFEYFRAYVWQAAHRSQKQVPDLEDFLRMRRDAGAIMPSFDLIELVEGTALPTGLYYSRTYQRMLIAAANVVCWTNDLMTLDKEMARGDDQNLVSVLVHAERLPLERAVDEAVARTDRQIESFLAAESELPALFDQLEVSPERREATLRCVASLRAWMRGHVEWGEATARYLDVDRSQGQPEYLDDLLCVRPAAGEETR
jgi:hypothetical protein